MSDSSYNPVRAVDTRKADRRQRDRLSRHNTERTDRSNHSAGNSDNSDNSRRSGEGSDTEVDDALISDDEKQWETIALERGLARRPSTTVSRVVAVARRHRWMLDTGLLVVILGLVVLLQLEVRQRPTKWQMGGDFMGEGPICT
jgi:hypothetical protein